MTWKKITNKHTGEFLQVYRADKIGETAEYWSYTHAAPNNATHTVIPDKPSEFHNFNGEEWLEDLTAIKARRETALEKQAREDHFNESSNKAKLDVARSSISSAKTKAEVERVSL